MSEKGFTVRLGARIDGYLAAMEAAKQKNKELVSSIDFDRLGGKMQDVGVKLSRSVTLPLIAAGGFAIKMSSDFESAFARMVGLAGVEAGEVDGLKKSVLALAGQTAKAPQELADALYEASSAGLNTAQAMDAVTIAARASAAGMGTAKDVVGLVASATASYGAANITAAKAADILTGTIKAGRADPAELAGSLGRILPVAAQLGISFEQVGGATAYLSNILGDTNRTVTALSGIFNKLVAPTAQGRKALTDMGGSAEELSKAVSQDGLTGALDYLRQHGFDKNSLALRAVFDDVEAFNGILALLNDKSGTLASTMEATATSTGSLDKAFAGAADTAGFKMKQAWADVQVAMIQAGDIVMPIASGIAGAIASLATEFSSLPGPVQTIVIGLLGLVAAAGPLLMLAGGLVKNFNEVKKAMTGMASGAGTAATALGAVGLIIIAASAIYSANAKKKQELVKTTNDFVDALGREAAGQKGAVTEQIGAMLADKNLVLNAQKFGLSISDLADVINGKSVPAFEKLKGSIDKGSWWNPIPDMVTPAEQAVIDFTGKVDVMRQGLAAAHDQVDLNALVQRELTAQTTETDRETRRLTAGVVDQAKAVSDLNVVLPLTDEQIKANAESTKSLNSALKDSTNKFEIMASAASLLGKALDLVFGSAQTLEEANRTLLAAVDATAQSIKDHGKTLDINTAAGRANREQVESHAKAILAQGVAMVGTGASTQAATDTINWNTAALRNQLLQAGLTEEQVAAYIATLGLTPENVTTAINLANDEATKTRLQGLLDQLGDIDAGAAASIQADIDQGKFDEAERQLLQIARDRNIKLNLVGGTGLTLVLNGGRLGVSLNAEGGVFDRARLGVIGEAGREVLLPTTRPARMASILADPTVSGPIAAAMPGGHMTSAATFGLGVGRSFDPAPAAVTHKTIQFGDINNTIDLKAAWQQANFALAAA